MKSTVIPIQMCIRDSVKGIMKKQIRKNRTYDTALGYTESPVNLTSIRFLIRNFQPTFYIHPVSYTHLIFSLRGKES